MSTDKFYVVGVDGSATSTAALRWAVGQAALTGARVRAVAAWLYTTAFEPGVVRRSAADLVAGHRKSLLELVGSVREPGVEVTSELVEGDPAEVLLDAANEADLLVLGSHGRAPLTSALMGSVGTRCLRHATCPVVIIPARSVAEKASETVAAASYQPGPII